MFEVNHFPSAITYLNQITHLEIGGGSYVMQNWQANPSHIDNQLHKHSFFEVCYVVSGEGLYLDGDMEFQLKSGDLFCSRPNIWHRIHKSDSLFLLWVCFDIIESESTTQAIESVRQLRKVERFFIRNAENSPAVLAWKSLLKQAERMYGLEYILTPLASGFLIALISTFLNSSELEHKTVLNTDPRRILQQAKSFIQDNLSQSLQFKQVADYLLVSERNLSRIFHDYDNQTFIQFLKTERLRRASDLLAHSNKSIKEVANECGFESVHYLTRVFTHAFGAPPGKYRNSIKKE